MKNSSILLTLALMIFSGCTPQETEEIDQTEDTQIETEPSAEDETTETDEISTLEREAACEDSGGQFSEENCECPDETFGKNNWPLYTYDEEMGYCIDPMGSPGGVLGEEIRANHPLAQ